MEQIISYILVNGPAALVLGTIIIAFIGVLKLCKVFDKIKNKDIKKMVYYILTVALSFGFVALYFTAHDIAFSNYVLFSCSQVGATTALYAIYENLGLRKLWQIALAWFASWFKKNPENKFVKALKGLGLNEDAIKRIQTLTDSEIKLNETNKTQEQPGKVE